MRRTFSPAVVEHYSRPHSVGLARRLFLLDGGSKFVLIALLLYLPWKEPDSGVGPALLAGGVGVLAMLGIVEIWISRLLERDDPLGGRLALGFVCLGLVGQLVVVSRGDIGAVPLLSIIWTAVMVVVSVRSWRSLSRRG